MKLDTSISVFSGAKLIIGWRELISFPEWGIKNIRAKADTGAKTTAMDVAVIEELSWDRVRFGVVLHRTLRHRQEWVEAPLCRKTQVRSSNGQVEIRYVVETLIQIGPIQKRIEVGLVCRKNMICRALIGRTTLEDTFLVDSKHTYLLRKPR